PSALTPTGVRRREPVTDEMIEEVARRVAVRQSGERRVLPLHANAGMQHCCRQKRRLACCKAIGGDGGDAFLQCHRSTCSAGGGSRGAPPPRPPAPRIRLARLWCIVKPDARLAAICRPL